MSETAFLWIRAVAFAAAALPALLSNLRSGKIPNLDSAIVLLSGLVVALAGQCLAVGMDNPSYAFWGMALVCLIGLALAGALPGGIAKFLIALLPWFDGPATYLLAVAIGFFATAAIGFARRGTTVRVVPAFWLAAVATLGFGAALA